MSQHQPGNEEAADDQQDDLLREGSRRKSAEGIADTASQDAMSPWQTYLRGVMMNITNPKVAIFFLAFLPQFADPSRGSMALQIVLLGAVFMLAALLTFSAVAWFAAGFGQVFKRSLRAQRVLNRIASVVFVGLALRLATVQR